MEYSVIRSSRKTLSVSVRDGKVIVRAPFRTAEKTIEDFVQRHRAWISKRVTEQENRYRPEFKDGEIIELFGKQRKIETGRARITPDTVFLPAENREKALIGLLKAFTRENMTAITEELARQYRFTYREIRIGSARVRWGSCNTRGTIAYTFRAAFLPMELAYYLAAHELCHTKHMNHGKMFWNLLKKIYPDCKERRKCLRQYSWALKCL